jgi:ABC-2 type transport system permease protein
MGAVQVTWMREFRAFRGAFSCAIPVTAFLAACGWSFVSALRQGEGGLLQIQTVWGLSVAPWLPVLCAILTMRLFADERASGMVDLLLSAPIRERDVVVGKFLSAMTVVAAALLFSLIVPAVVLPWVSAPMRGALHLLPLLSTVGILLLQASTCCAIGLAASVFSRTQSAAAVTSLVLCCGLPAAFYVAVLFWMPSIRMEVSSFPMLVHVYDFSTGLFSTGTVAAYLFPALFFLFACSKRLAALRLRG